MLDLLAKAGSRRLPRYFLLHPIVGFSSAGSCPTNDGLVALALRDDNAGKKQLLIALTAKLNNYQVVVRADDAYKTASGGLCYLIPRTQLIALPKHTIRC